MMNNFSQDPLANDQFFDFSSLINTAMSIERENNALLDTFTWNSNFVLPLAINNNHAIEGLSLNQTLWLEKNVEFEFTYKNTLWKNNKSIQTISAFDFIEQRFRFLSRADGHATRNYLTAQEIIFLEFQTCEFFDNFENCTLCVCEVKSIISWLVRLINIILTKNDIIDLDFERINNSFLYYKNINMNEVRCFLNMYENNHNLVEKFFF
jgi:hypothetical protein